MLEHYAQINKSALLHIQLRKVSLALMNLASMIINEDRIHDDTVSISASYKK